MSKAACTIPLSAARRRSAWLRAVGRTVVAAFMTIPAYGENGKPSHDCHPKRSEGSLRQRERSLAALGMTVRLYQAFPIPVLRGGACLPRLVLSLQCIEF